MVGWCSPTRGWRPAAATFFAILTCLLCCLALLPARGAALPTRPAPALPATPPASEAPVRLEVVEQTPQVLTGREDFHLTVQLVNDSARELRNVQLDLRLQAWTPIARTKLEDWIDDPRAMASISLQTAHLDTLAAGEGRRIELPVSAAALPAMDRGPRGLVVTATSEDINAAATSFLVYWPPSEFPPLHYAAVIPLVASAEEIGKAPETITATRRAEQLAALANERAVTLAADPQFTAATGLDVPTRAELPAGDPDVQVLSSTDGGKRQLAKAAGEQTAGAQLLWWPTLVNAATFTSAPPGALVIADDRGLTHERYYTPSALTTIRERPTMVADSVLSDHLRASGNLVLHRQALLAHLAATVRERPNDPRLIVLAAQRNVDATAAQLPEKLQALADQPWLSGTPLPRPSSTGTEQSWPDARQVFDDWHLAQAITATTPLWDRIAEPVGRMRALAATTSQPGEVSGQVDMLVTRVLTTALAGHGDIRAELIGEITKQSNQIAEAIRVETPSSVLLIADTTEIPLTVENALPAAANVQVTFVATDPRLQPGELKATELPGNSRTTVRVPVNAVGSGNVWMSVRVMDERGHLIATSPAFEVRVRADWENVGTGIVAAILLAVMITGLVRTILKHRSAPRGARRGEQRTPTIPPAHLRTKETNR